MMLSLERNFDKKEKEKKAGGFILCYAEASGLCQGATGL
jgi:hypothetical protein